MAFMESELRRLMLLKGLLRRQLKGLEGSGFDGSILSGDPALSYLFLCWAARRLSRFWSYRRRCLKNDKTLKGMHSNQQLCFPQ